MKSDMPGSGARYQAKEVGQHLYVWSMENRPLRKKCVISSHGSIALICNESERIKLSKLPSEVQIVFYGPHGYTLNDPSVAKVAMGLVKDYEKLAVCALS